MIKLTRTVLAPVAIAFFAAYGAQAGNLTDPTYPLNSVEQLYADLYKLSPKDRHKKIVEGAKKEGKLELVHAITGSLGRNHTKIFEKTYPFIKVAHSSLGSNLAMERMINEESAGKHFTNVISGTEITENSLALEKGYLARYPTPAAKKILPQYEVFLDPHNRWLLTHWSEQGISYNATMLKRLNLDPPKKWEDLCNQKYKGQVSFEPARTRFLLFLNQLMGEEKMVEWLKCMGQNKPILMRGKTLRLQLMLAGDHAIQGHNFFYKGTLWRQQKGEKKVPFVAVYGAPILGAGAGCLINRNTSNPYTSALYCDWGLDDEPQAYMKKEYRGTVTLSHAFLPTDVQLITLRPAPLERVKKLHELWNKYMRQKS